MSYATTKQQLMYLTIIFFYKISELLMRELYYHPDCLANILCFHDLAEKKLVTFDAENNEFVVKIKKKDINSNLKVNSMSTMRDQIKEIIA